MVNVALVNSCHIIPLGKSGKTISRRFVILCGFLLVEYLAPLLAHTQLLILKYIISILPCLEKEV